MSAPKELFYLEVHTAPGDGLHYQERGGGKFTSLVYARDRKAMVLNRHENATVRILRTQTKWEEVE